MSAPTVSYHVVLTVQTPGGPASMSGVAHVTTGATRAELMAWARQQLPQHIQNAPAIYYSAERQNLVSPAVCPKRKTKRWGR